MLTKGLEALLAIFGVILGIYAFYGLFRAFKRPSEGSGDSEEPRTVLDIAPYPLQCTNRRARGFWDDGMTESTWRP